MALPTLEVLISTYGPQGLQRVAQMTLPKHKRVRYLVCCQTDDYNLNAFDTSILAYRKDIQLKMIPGKGLSANRNAALSFASADYLLIADDDLHYTAEQLLSVIDKFDSNAALDIACFMPLQPYHRYPKRELIITAQSRHRHYPQSCEIALRRTSWQKSGVLFSSLFGINSGYLESGEDDIFFHQLLCNGLTAKYFPEAIFSHPHPSSGYKQQTPGMLRARGAVLSIVHPRTYKLRILRLALLLPGSARNNLRLMLDGVTYLQKHSLYNR